MSSNGTASSVLRFGNLVRKARERRGWSQTILAETAHVDHNIISGIELGRVDPNFSLVADLVRILDISIEDAVFNQRVSKQRKAETAEETTT